VRRLALILALALSTATGALAAETYVVSMKEGWKRVFLFETKGTPWDC